MLNSFIAINFLYLLFSNPDALICVSSDRNQICPAPSGDPVCAVYSGGDCISTTGYCLKQMDSGCDACIDGSVAGYVLGECSALNVQSCSEEHDNAGCFSISGDACGITEVAGTGGNDPTVKKTKYTSGCDACNSGASDFYVNGDYWGQCIAVSTSSVCKSQDRGATNCQAVGTLACAYYTGGDCTEPICRKTTDGYCFACADPNVMFYQIGDCADLVPIGPGGIGEEFEEEEEEVEEYEEEEMIEEEEEVEVVDPCAYKRRRRLL